MSDHAQYGPKPFPKPILYGAGLMIALTIAMATWGRLSGKGSIPPPRAEVVSERHLLFADQADGSVRIVDADTGALVHVLAPGTNGFTRSLMRGMARERTRSGVGAKVPFTLILWDDGRLTLRDPATGRRVFLNAFGVDNVDDFAALLPRQEGNPS